MELWVSDRSGPCSSGEFDIPRGTGAVHPNRCGVHHDERRRVRPGQIRGAGRGRSIHNRHGGRNWEGEKVIAGVRSYCLSTGDCVPRHILLSCQHS